MTEYLDGEVIIIGDGATGADIVRDCARRELRTLLIKRRDIVTGATGCNHGLLHSSARHVVTDNESARECISEDHILCRIARHRTEPTNGLFITLSEDNLAYQQTFIAACQQAGIEATPFSSQEALHREPAVNPTLPGAVQVPDGIIDPFRLTVANMPDAREYGTQILTGCEVTNLLCRDDYVCGVQVYDRQLHRTRTLYVGMVVNAAGIQGQHVVEYANLHITIFPAKGSLLILDHQINNLVISRCRKPADADILVPGDITSLIGITLMHIPYDGTDSNRVITAEADTLLRGGEKLAPVVGRTRILRAYSGVHPLMASDNDPSGRGISRGIALLDYVQHDGVEGFITTIGGKLMTYRLTAEWATGAVCRKLGNTTPCSAAETPLPGLQEPTESTLQRIISLPAPPCGSTVCRHGNRIPAWLGDSCQYRSLACECEAVTADEVKYAVENLAVNTLPDLRRRTRVGMGICQGKLCACRVAGLLQRFNATTLAQSSTQLSTFLNERWKDMQPIAQGDALCESEFTRWVYLGLCGLSQEYQDGV